MVALRISGVDGERVIFGFIPLLLAALALLASLLCLARRPSAVQVLLTLPAALGLGCALVMLFSMLYRPAWPSYIPHILIALLLPVVLAQWLLARQHHAR